jgi:hypothetical protein
MAFIRILDNRKCRRSKEIAPEIFSGAILLNSLYYAFTSSTLGWEAGLWRTGWAIIAHTWVRIQTLDPSLDAGVDGSVGRDVIRQYLVHEILGGGSREEVWIAIAAARHEIILSNDVA